MGGTKKAEITSTSFDITGDMVVPVDFQLRNNTSTADSRQSIVCGGENTIINAPGTGNNPGVFLKVRNSSVLKVTKPTSTNIGNVAITGNLSVSGTYPTSDDRLKWNETPITNALDTIRLLKPQTYDKAYSIPEDGSQPENTFREAGFVAQEVLEIPELVQFVRPDGVEEVEVPSTDAENAAIDEAHKALRAQKVVEAQAVEDEDEARITVERAITTQLEARLAEVRAAAVHPDTTRIKPYALNYNSIFTHMIAAVKELDTLVQAQAARIAVLEAQN